MKKVYQYALISAVSLGGASFIASSVEAMITQEEVESAKATYKTNKTKDTKFEYKRLKAQRHTEEMKSLIANHDSNSISVYLQKYAEHLNARKSKTSSRLQNPDLEESRKERFNTKIKKIHKDWEKVEAVLNLQTPERIEYIKDRIKATTERTEKMKEKLDNLKNPK